MGASVGIVGTAPPPSESAFAADASVEAFCLSWASVARSRASRWARVRATGAAVGRAGVECEAQRKGTIPPASMKAPSTPVASFVRRVCAVRCLSRSRSILSAIEPEPFNCQCHRCHHCHRHPPGRSCSAAASATRLPVRPIPFGGLPAVTPSLKPPETGPVR